MELAKSKQRILVIDDEIEIGEMICEILNPHFETVMFISEADKVADHLDEVNYDLVLSDINMPKLDGTSLVSLIRSKGHLTSVIFVSGNVTLEKALKALRLGVADIIDDDWPVSSQARS
ncbi:MAG: response regulator [Bdellovibrionaceae bacterium]|nr:response regulator [Pseudobdellovibrionaceae bacterium]